MIKFNGGKISDKVANGVGSWRFIIIQSISLIVWMIANTLGAKKWDAYPFTFLNLVLSFQAAYATPFILMSQNRQSRSDRKRAELDLQCDLEAKESVINLHEKMDSLKDQEIAELLKIVNRQHEIILKLENNILEKVNELDD